MRKLAAILSAFALILTVQLAGAAKPGLSTADKASLQASMQQHIDRNLVEGSYLYLKPDSGEVQALHPTTAHPMILRMGQYYVLCSDFRDDKGGAVNVDFYLARRGRGFVVFHTAVAQRGQVEQLMKAGKVEKFD